MGMRIKKIQKLCFSSGFTLVEMAIVLLILGVMLGGLMTAIGQSTENTRRLEAKNTLREIEEALYGFAQIQGRLPCPASFNTSGVESVSDPLAGTCNLNHGLIPNATLGLSGGVDTNGLMLDPWDNPYRYSVAGTTSPGGFLFTGSTGIQNIYNSPTDINNAGNLLKVCDNTACNNPVIMSDIVPAVVLSMGKNWAEISTTSAEEQENAGDGTVPLGNYAVSTTANFVVTGYSEENFDDMLIWISPHLLLSRMINAGKLP